MTTTKTVENKTINNTYERQLNTLLEHNKSTIKITEEVHTITESLFKVLFISLLNSSSTEEETVEINKFKFAINNFYVNHRKTSIYSIKESINLLYNLSTKIFSNNILLLNIKKVYKRLRIPTYKELKRLNSSLHKIDKPINATFNVNIKWELTHLIVDSEAKSLFSLEAPKEIKDKIKDWKDSLKRAQTEKTKNVEKAIGGITRRVFKGLVAQGLQGDKLINSLLKEIEGIIREELSN